MSFERIAVVWNPQDAPADALAHAVGGMLRAHGCTVGDIPLRVHDDPVQEAAAATAAQALGAQLALVLGGDGTLLAAARAFDALALPLLGIHRGRLGFLVDLTAEAIADELPAILGGGYRLERRLKLDATVERGGRPVACLPALNEVAVHKWDSLRMIEVETCVEGRVLHRQRADGLIVSTPTGSTAYALSAGGPILYPDLDALVLVPVCQHTLGIRPMVLGTAEVSLTLTDTRHAHAHAVWDGQRSVPLEVGDRLVVRPRPGGATLLHPLRYDYFDLLRSKLHWGR
jgi:NAD+ kinase